MAGPWRVRFAVAPPDSTPPLWEPDAYVSENGDRVWWMDGNGIVAVCCPWCGEIGQITTRGPNAWTWNGDMERPTVSPSILVTGGPGGCGMHVWVRDGQIIDAGTPSHAPT